MDELNPNQLLTSSSTRKWGDPSNRFKAVDLMIKNHLPHPKSPNWVSESTIFQVLNPFDTCSVLFPDKI